MSTLTLNDFYFQRHSGMNFYTLDMFTVFRIINPRLDGVLGNQSALPDVNRNVVYRNTTIYPPPRRIAADRSSAAVSGI